ncbi:MAG TPA: cytochrome c-type biogenesis protein [Ramlibacter sp.]|uniref:cytochrome c-type biogenesis protein n=1 Tax=Ramlibacter sp. TaxID=1917967 RepID=UPI002CD58714|nr:cytochrome c-type biogenesis protein [Ramlibacter sp.]HVZ43689.1 cytochrome c-type biogenesis protein [Ramlibacter sp.]
MNRLIVALLAICALCAALIARAGEAQPLAQDPAVEQRLIAIAEEVRCLVCQNESLAGSRAELAEDLRREIRGQIRQGRSDAEILDFLVSRYGDFVLYRPRVKPLTWLLWFGPLLLLAGGGYVLVRTVCSGRRGENDTDNDLETA